MNWSRGLFRAWAAFSVLWVVCFILYGAANWQLLTGTTKYMVSGPNGWKYEVTAATNTPPSEILAYVQDWAKGKNFGDCAPKPGPRGPWCNYAIDVDMPPHGGSIWPLVAIMLAGPCLLLAFGWGLRWIVSGFRSPPPH